MQRYNIEPSFTVETETKECYAFLIFPMSCRCTEKFLFFAKSSESCASVTNGQQSLSCNTLSLSSGETKKPPSSYCLPARQKRFVTRSNTVEKLFLGTPSYKPQSTWLSLYLLTSSISRVALLESEVYYLLSETNSVSIIVQLFARFSRVEDGQPFFDPFKRIHFIFCGIKFLVGNK